jgi:hypothetical protein
MYMMVAVHILRHNTGTPYACNHYMLAGVTLIYPAGRKARRLYNTVQVWMQQQPLGDPNMTRPCPASTKTWAHKQLWTDL